MKLRLPHSLFLFLLSLTVTLPSAADVVGAGVYYDVGKIHYSGDSNAKMPGSKGATDDSDLCWAAAASNVTQYWQDTYGNFRDKDTTLISGTQNGYSSPYGTDYLNIYHEVLKNARIDSTNDPEQFFGWWFKGTAAVNAFKETVLDERTGSYTRLFGDGEFLDVRKMYSVDDISMKELTAFVVNAFKVQGQAVELSTMGNAHHAITCWGYELNKQGNLSALILSDSDDQYFGAFRMELSVTDPYIIVDSRFGTVVKYAAGGQYTMRTDDQFGYYSDTDAALAGLAVIVTPESYVNEDGSTVSVREEATGAAKVLSGKGDVLENTRLANEDLKTVLKGGGLVVGNGRDVIILTSETGHTLEMDGGSVVDTTALTVRQGGMVSLNNLSVSNYTEGGLNLQSKTYLHDGSVKISNNGSSGDGAGVYNATYLEIQNCSGEEAVVFEKNKTTAGKGGAIYNDGAKSNTEGVDGFNSYVQVSIRGNSEVVFRGNEAAEGNDIYNAKNGIINIADNGEVRFESQAGDNVSVVNKGRLYLAANEDQSIVFKETTLSSPGQTYVGKDVKGDVYREGSVRFEDASDGSTELSSTNFSWAYEKIEDYSSPEGYFVYEYWTGEGGLLDNVSVSAHDIAGVSAGSSRIQYLGVSDTAVLKLSSLTVDTTSHLAAAEGITLSKVTVDMSTIQSFAVSSSGEYTRYDFDIAALCETGSLTLSSVVFDVSRVEELSLQENDIIYVHLGEGVTDITATTVLLKGADGYYAEVNAENGVVTFRGLTVPEPATSALSLLALAGLAARRRRR